MHSGSAADQLATIVIDIQKNVEGSEEELFAHLGRGIRLLIFRHLRNDSDTEDGVQECFMAVLAAIRNASLREPAAVAGFAVTVARRYAARVIDSRVKSRQRDLAVQSAVIPTGATQELDHYRSEKVELLRAALLRLSASDREILERFYLLEESEQEIRQQMGLTENQFRLKKSRAKVKLAEEAQRLAEPTGIRALLTSKASA